ncbi:hypothetical protein Y032_0003g1294 [Ancylostoma ceylanicum]|uniref:Aminopeptidase n=1 Tax=Ancylostoma ceylanicum TaxID=53326 RepID=A0A016VX40_9BILA|nr:hypothetical protein Y032_0003g1294 [Ancylostoma ceylanicum]
MVVVQATNAIVLNMKDIVILLDKCEARSNTVRLTITNINIDEHFDRVTFVLAETVHIGQEVSLKVNYVGFVNDKLRGLYQTTYTDLKGKLKMAAVSHCEPMEARRIVPCFDEPKYKAVWNVTIIHPNGTKAIANAMELSETTEPNGKWKVSRFRPTPILASYLVALFVSEFDYDETYTNRGVRFRLWSTPATRHKREFGLKVAITFMELFEEYFGIQDVTMKQDMVALPDFCAGAMENWGLITFRENFLLVYGRPNIVHTSQITVAHELAHQWFGNMVTLKDWNEVWLKEGFAKYFENTMLDNKIDNGLNLYGDLATMDFEKALEKDSFATSHPLCSSIETASEVYESFDDISYSKGSAIIAMTLKIVGEKKFKEGLNHYIKKFFLQNAQGDDWWNSLDQALEGSKEGPNGGSLKMWYIGRQWTRQMGFPLVTVKTLNSTTVKVWQQRYLKNPNALELLKYRSPSYGYKWDILLHYQTGKEIFGSKWLKREEPLYLNIGEGEKAVVVNVDRSGYFRQNYDPRGWQNILKQFKEDHEIYSARTRFGVISDAFAAAQVDRLDYKTVFQLLEYLPKEQSSMVWDIVKSGLVAIVDFFGNEPEAEFAKRYVNKIMKIWIDMTNPWLHSDDPEEGVSSTTEEISTTSEEVSSTTSESRTRRKYSKRSQGNINSESSFDNANALLK